MRPPDWRICHQTGTKCLTLPGKFGTLCFCVFSHIPWETGFTRSMQPFSRHCSVLMFRRPLQYIFCLHYDQRETKCHLTLWRMHIELRRPQRHSEHEHCKRLQCFTMKRRGTLCGICWNSKLTLLGINNHTFFLSLSEHILRPFFEKYIHMLCKWR